MAKLCNETLKIYQEIFDQAYVLGRTSGSQGIFICPKVAFESFFKEKLLQGLAGQTGVEFSTLNGSQGVENWTYLPKERLS